VAIRFTKGHGTGNDFVVLYDPERRIDLTPVRVRALCDRHAGLGADGVLRVVLAATDPQGATMSDDARWFMDYRNADGSISETCGNGIRVFARYLVDSYLEPPGSLRVATRAGVVDVRLGTLGDVTVDMGLPTFPDLGAIEVSTNGASWAATAVHLPNPHAIAVVDDLSDAGPLTAAPIVTPPGAFPDGVNVEFVEDRGAGRIAMRVHERGVGETLSCGTGACAAMLATRRRLDDPLPATYAVAVPGGELTVTQREDGHVELCGPAVLVCDGEVREEWLLSYA
jgi:diaminopimelate epimerase